MQVLSETLSILGSIAAPGKIQNWGTERLILTGQGHKNNGWQTEHPLEKNLGPECGEDTSPLLLVLLCYPAAGHACHWEGPEHNRLASKNQGQEINCSGSLLDCRALKGLSFFLLPPLSPVNLGTHSSALPKLPCSPANLTPTWEPMLHAIQGHSHLGLPSSASVGRPIAFLFPLDKESEVNGLLTSNPQTYSEEQVPRSGYGLGENQPPPTLPL